MIPMRFVFCRLCRAVTVFVLLTPLGLIAGPPAERDPADVLAQNDSAKDDSAPDDDQAAIRLEYMIKALQKYHVVLDGDKSQKANLDPDVFLRWSNPVGDVADGLLSVYTPAPDARPAAIAHFHVHGPVLNGLEMHEFADVHPGKVELYRGQRLVWSPEERYSEFQTLADGPKPSSKAVLRTSQIKKMAERFEVIDAFRAPNSEPEPQPLRMMARPTYRYGSDKDGTLVDGALFTYVLATDPEACLLIEVRSDGETHTWQYAFVPMTIYALEARLEDDTVWTKPEAMVFANSRAPHYIASYRGDPGEPSLRTIAPTTGEK